MRKLIVPFLALSFLGLGSIPVIDAVKNPQWAKSEIQRNQAPDINDFEEWLRDPNNVYEYTQFVVFLEENNVKDVVEPWWLLRQGADWELAGEEAFALPPRKQWQEIIPTLVTLRDVVIPKIGPVEVVSGFRTQKYNQAVGGSTGSRHVHFEAVDLIPTIQTSHKDLIAKLGDIYTTHGNEHDMGLGMYADVKFHIDTHRHRKW